MCEREMAQQMKNRWENKQIDACMHEWMDKLGEWVGGWLNG